MLVRLRKASWPPRRLEDNFKGFGGQGESLHLVALLAPVHAKELIEICRENSF